MMFSRLALVAAVAAVAPASAKVYLKEQFNDEVRVTPRSFFGWSVEKAVSHDDDHRRRGG